MLSSCHPSNTWDLRFLSLHIFLSICFIPPEEGVIQRKNSLKNHLRCPFIIITSEIIIPIAPIASMIQNNPTEEPMKLADPSAVCGTGESAPVLLKISIDPEMSVSAKHAANDTYRCHLTCFLIGCSSASEMYFIST